MNPQEQATAPRKIDDLSQEEQRELNARRQAYNESVEDWIHAIRAEESMAHPERSTAAVDEWENAHFAEENARNKTKQLRQDYLDELRRILYQF